MSSMVMIAKRIDFIKSSRHVLTNGNYVEVTDVLISWMVMIISQRICISKDQVVHLKYIRFSLKGKKENVSQCPLT